MRLVLASASPRRRGLVGLLGLPWRLAPQDIPEASYALDEPLISAMNVALAKARSAAPDLQRDEAVLAADTVVAADGVVLGKPVAHDEARAMLASLRGRAHTVATGVALLTADARAWAAVVTTSVHMRGYSSSEVERYVRRGEPFDKAGGYAIQDDGFRPVERVAGCYLNVVGLPLCAIARGLETLGAPAPEMRGFTPPCGYCRVGQEIVRIPA